MRAGGSHTQATSDLEKGERLDGQIVRTKKERRKKIRRESTAQVSNHQV